MHSVADARRSARASVTAAALSRLWRTKQLEYTWLQSLMASPDSARGLRCDHRACARTTRTPRSCCRSMPTPRTGLPTPILRLPPFLGRACGACARWRRDPRWILSNGTRAHAGAAGSRRRRLDAVLDGVLSVDEAGVYKPSPRVYRARGCDRLGVAAGATIAFVSSNGWDAAGAQGVRLHHVLDQPRWPTD